MLFTYMKLLYKLSIFLDILLWNKTLLNPYENIKIKEHFPKTFREKLMLQWAGGVFAEGCTGLNNPAAGLVQVYGPKRCKITLQRKTLFLHFRSCDNISCASWESAGFLIGHVGQTMAALTLF